MKKTEMKKLVTAALVAAGIAAGAMAANEAPMPSYDGYVVAADQSNDKDWMGVANALAKKHQAKVLNYNGREGLPGLVMELRKLRPRYICFVAPPESVGREFVAFAMQALRFLDNVFQDLIRCPAVVRHIVHGVRCYPEYALGCFQVVFQPGRNT